MEMTTVQMYTLGYFAGLISVIMVLMIFLGFIYLIVETFKKMMISIFGDSDTIQDDYDE